VHWNLDEQKGYEQVIAGTLDVSPNTAASRYRYGVDKLQALLRLLYEELR